MRKSSGFEGGATVRDYKLLENKRWIPVAEMTTDSLTAVLEKFIAGKVRNTGYNETTAENMIERIRIELVARELR